MIGRFISFIVSCCVFSAFAYVFFLVPLGQRTLWQHSQRIWHTSEAQDLSLEASQAAIRVTKDVEAKWQEAKARGEAADTVPSIQAPAAAAIKGR